MLKTIIIDNFFSFKGETTVKLNSEINLLLGINGSGKTSFINDSTKCVLSGYQAAKQYADSHGIKIYNATRGGKLFE